MIPINRPIMGNEEADAVLKVIESGVLTNPSPEGGPNVKVFEGELASYVGAKHAVAINSGTGALFLALLATGIGHGDEVIIPSFTFIATASTVMLTGAKPVFADIDRSTYNMSPKAFKKAMTKKTRAAMPVDLYGLPAEMDEIREIAAEEGLAVIEDACQAQGASYKGRMAGTLADIGCFSFYPGKVMTTGEGGAAVTNDGSLADKLRKMRTHGQVKGYDSAMLGGNFRMPEIEAAIGRVQLSKLPGFLKKRAENANLLTDMLNGTGVIPPIAPNGMKHNWYLYTVRCASLDERERLKARMNDEGIGATAYYPTPVNKTPYYASQGFSKISLPETDNAADSVLSLPVNPAVTENDLERMGHIVKKACDQH